MIQFLNADHPFRVPQKRKTRGWLQGIIHGYEKTEGEINIICCSDAYMLNINQRELNHDTYTDIITFDFCVGDVTSGDLFISVDRTKENARTFGVKHQIEFSRVMAHGILHLIGFHDKTPKQKASMREAENRALAQLFHVKP